ncbi:hypothetical protein GCM10009836_59500 [Pseudonocardia ailaonensis]|uniref:Nucleoid-associated protein GCM10009836_59500 n=1 Tax=Pseudonocardia ailaonensis TaxID=367279 RepID=A0ABN2NIL7_9PSEU
MRPLSGRAGVVVAGAGVAAAAAEVTTGGGVVVLAGTGVPLVAPEQATSTSPAARTDGTRTRSGAGTTPSLTRLRWSGDVDTARSVVVQPGGQPDMSMILQQAQKMQEQLMAAQQELAEAEVTGQAGNGLVQVTQTAAGEILSVTIDPKIVDPEDVETLQDLVVGAIQDAARAAQELQAQKMGPLAGGLGDLGGGFGLPGA